MPTAPETTYQEISPLSSDAESDDDPIVRTPRDSTEIARQDNTLLEEEDEREKLISDQRRKQESAALFDKDGISGSKPKTRKSERRQRRTRKGKRKKYQGLGEDGELLYEMEEGGPHSETSSQASSSSTELDRMNLQRGFTSIVSIHRPLIR